MYPGVHARTQPQRPALVMAGSAAQVSYAELDDRSARLAAFFRRRGLREGDTVVIAMENDLRWGEVVWACLRSGLVPWTSRAPCSSGGGRSFTSTTAHPKGTGRTAIGPGEWLEHPGSVGRPVGGSVLVADDDGRQLPAGAAGTVWFQQPGAPEPVRAADGSVDLSALPGWGSVRTATQPLLVRAGTDEASISRVAAARSGGRQMLSANETGHLSATAITPRGSSDRHNRSEALS